MEIKFEKHEAFILHFVEEHFDDLGLQQTELRNSEEIMKPRIVMYIIYLFLLGVLFLFPQRV